MHDKFLKCVKYIMSTVQVRNWLKNYGYPKLWFTTDWIRKLTYMYYVCSISHFVLYHAILYFVAIHEVCSTLIILYLFHTILLDTYSLSHKKIWLKCFPHFQIQYEIWTSILMQTQINQHICQILSKIVKNHVIISDIL